MEVGIVLILFVVFVFALAIRTYTLNKQPFVSTPPPPPPSFNLERFNSETIALTSEYELKFQLIEDNERKARNGDLVAFHHYKTHMDDLAKRCYGLESIILIDLDPTNVKLAAYEKSLIDQYLQFKGLSIVEEDEF